jgi:hypothetical protein
VGLENAVIAGASLTHHIALVEGQVIFLENLDQLPIPDTAPTASTDARLGPDDAGGHHVIAGVAELPIAAAAALRVAGVGDVVAVCSPCRLGTV